ncbi:MAG: zinc-finger domain-containing protein [Proteobacteria bacterium]|nr:zinc-finger domain-containing protein [Pseudomonadota bacterium]
MLKEVNVVSSEIISCEGFDAPYGHPKIYLNIPHQTEIKCPYCSRLYFRK